MLRSFFQKCAIFFIISLLFCVPIHVFALEVSPAVADVSFADVSQNVSQVFSVKNTEDISHTYDARVQLVTFASDGSIADLVEVPDVFDATVFPEEATLLPQEEQSFEVMFHHPEHVTSRQAFALVLYEKNTASQQLSSGFIALLFPTGLVEQVQPSFRIDAFTVRNGHAGWEAAAQFTNTGTSLARPASMIVAKDVWGREIMRTLFSDHEGRLPVGTTRVISDVLPFADFGMWHWGGYVTFSLLSVDEGGGEVQEAVVTLFTWPGKGALILEVFGVVFFMGALLFFAKKRGILRA